MNYKNKIFFFLLFFIYITLSAENFSEKPNFDKYFELSQHYFSELGLEAEKEDIYNFYFREYDKRYKKSIISFSYGKKGYFHFDNNDNILCFDYTPNNVIDNDHKNIRVYDTDFYEKIIKKYVKILRPDINIDKLVRGNHELDKKTYFFRYYEKTLDKDIIYSHYIRVYYKKWYFRKNNIL